MEAGFSVFKDNDAFLPAFFMKIAIVRQRYTPFGGAERFVDRALGALARDGAEVTLITRSWEGGDATGFRKIIVDPPCAGLAKILGGRVERDRRFLEGVQQVIAKNAFDIVQSHERIPGCTIFRAGDGVHAAWLDHRGRSQGTLARQAARFDPYHRYVLAQETAMLAHPNLQALICNSTMVRDEFIRYYGVAPKKIEVIENGIDLDHFHPQLAETYRSPMRRQLGISEDSPVFIYVGGGFERKGVGRLVRALASMRNPDARLIVVGGDRTLAAMQKLASRLGLGARVHFAGRQTDVRPLLAMSDAFVLPTLYDPMPNAALEGLAMALPTITSTTCGIASRIVPGANGYVCDALNVSALAEYMDNLAQPGVAAGMREAARRSVEDLSLESMSASLLSLYRRLDTRQLEKSSEGMGV